VASAKEEVFFSKAPLTPEEEVGKASPAPVSMEEEWVQSSSASSSWPMMGLVRGELGSDMGCCTGCTAVRIGLEDDRRNGMKVPSPDIARFRLDWERKGVGWWLVGGDMSAAGDVPRSLTLHSKSNLKQLVQHTAGACFNKIAREQA